MDAEVSMIRTLGTILCLLAVTALAHHGWTGYDESKPLNVTGTIREMSYENPHGIIKLEVTGGKTWTVWLAPPSRMDTRGLSKDAIKVGTTVSVVAYQDKAKPDEMRAERIIVAGKTTELR